jgi:hypothetical protein
VSAHFLFEATEDTLVSAHFGMVMVCLRFVSGGRWPSSDLEEDEGLHFLSQNIYVKKNATGAEYAYGFVDESQHRRAQDTNPFTAGIARSVDRGATWETVFETDTAGYCACAFPPRRLGYSLVLLTLRPLCPCCLADFNQISCFDDNNCVVVEGGGSARIVTSTDRGASWQQTLDATGSLMAVQCIEGTGEGWAAGGILGFQFVGHYWHTMDFGATWQLVEVRVGSLGCAGSSCSFVFVYRGLSSAPTVNRFRACTPSTSLSPRTRTQWVFPPPSLQRPPAWFATATRHNPQAHI